MNKLNIAMAYALGMMSLVQFEAGADTIEKAFRNESGFSQLAQDKPRIMNTAMKKAAGEDVITNPEGDRVVFSRSSVSVMPVGDVPMDTEDYGFAGVMVFGDNGEVYLKNPFSQFLTGSYLVGKVDGDRIVIDLPQQVMVYEEDGEAYDLFACMLTLSAAGDEMVIEPSENQQLVFVSSDGRWVMEDQESMLGMTFDDSVWAGFGEMMMTYAPVEEVPAESPEGAEYQQWMMTYGGEGHFVDVAVIGDKCYVKNFLPVSDSSLAPIVGNVTEEGISFPSPQYLGVNEDNSYLTYFYGGDVEVTYIEEYNTTVTTFVPGDELKFAIQEDGTYKAENSAIFTPFTDILNEYFWYMDVFEKPSLREGVAANLVPANPSVVDYRYYSNYGFGYVSLEIPMLNTEGMILDSSRLYYNVYLDGEILEFVPDEYPLFTENMTDIPYNFVDGIEDSGDIKIDGTKHTIILYREGIEEIGVQSFYIDEEGNKYYSELVTSDTSGINGVESFGGPIVEEYYLDMQGRRVASPDGGFFIKVVRHADGTLKTSKHIR